MLQKVVVFRILEAQHSLRRDFPGCRYCKLFGSMLPESMPVCSFAQRLFVLPEVAILTLVLVWHLMLQFTMYRGLSVFWH